MYKFLSVWLAVIGMATTTHAQQTQKMNHTPSNSKILVAYFSATGTTARAAETLATVTGGTLHEIQPAVPYTSADLDWHDRKSRSSTEMNDPKSRPAIADSKVNIVDYDIIFIGYPIWWNLAPRIINTFLESFDLQDKTLIPFATSGGSSLSHSATTLKTAYPSLHWKEGRLLNHASEESIQKWIDLLKII